MTLCLTAHDTIKDAIQHERYKTFPTSAAMDGREIRDGRTVTDSRTTIRATGNNRDAPYARDPRIIGDIRDPRFADATRNINMRTAPPVTTRDQKQFDRRRNDYFLPGEGINREVVAAEICNCLGADALVRPYRHEDVSVVIVTRRLSET